MKKILACLFILLFLSVQTMPSFAKNKGESVTVNFQEKLNVNKISTGDSVALKVKENTTISSVEIPAGTTFYGKIDTVRHSRGGFISAKTTIVINEMVLPNGKTIPVSSYVDKLKIKSSGWANLGKGILTTPFTIIDFAFGGVVIVFECASIAGIIFLPSTIGTIAHNTSVLTKGVNRKVSKNKDIKLYMTLPSNLQQAGSYE